MLDDFIAWLADLPTWQMFVGFWMMAVVRGIGYYAFGMVMGSRLRGARWHDARAKVRELGVRSIVMTWPVYGLAAATQVVTGAVRMPMRHFLGALVPLCALWAVLQTVLGIVVIEALMTRAAPWILAAIVLFVVLRLVASRRHSRVAHVEVLQTGNGQ